jgi:hypothetical protein
MTLRSALTAMLLSVFILSIAGVANAAVTRVTVSVKTETGQPVQGSLFRALVDGQEPSLIDAATDAAGSATLTFEVPPGASFIEVRHGFSSPSTIAREDQTKASELSTENTIRYHFDSSYRVPLASNQSSYDLHITAWPAVSATASFVDSENRPLAGTLFGPPVSWPGGWNPREARPLRGLRKGAASDVAAVAYVGPILVVKLVHLEADRTKGDIDLGAIRFDQPTTGAAIATKLVGDRSLRASGARVGPMPGMTAISTDGRLIATFRAGHASPDSAGDAPLDLLSSEHWKPVLPPGEYVVVPGYFLYSELQAMVVRLLARGVDLSKSDIPRINVREGAANDEVVDLVKCHEAIVRLAAREGVVPTNDRGR